MIEAPFAADLGGFLRSAGARPFDWGADNCGLLIADWWAANHGFDPAAHLRRASADRDACHAMLRDQGGLARLVRRLAASVGAARVHEDQPGDFGIIRQGDAHLAAIRTATGRWAVKAEAGIAVFKNPKVVIAWHV